MSVGITVSMIDPISTNISSLFYYRFIIIVYMYALLQLDHYITVLGPGAPTP